MNSSFGEVGEGNLANEDEGQAPKQMRELQGQEIDAIILGGSLRRSETSLMAQGKKDALDDGGQTQSLENSKKGLCNLCLCPNSF